MLVKLVFEDWRKRGTVGSIYQTEEGVELSMRNFHSGTVFRAALHLSDKDDDTELAEAIKAGYEPVFMLVSEEEPADATK